jgi:di/tricarboxylate transporter
MVGFGCVSPGDARRSVEWQVLVTIAAALGVGAALQASGAATAVAGALVASTRAWGAIAALAAVYVIGSILTELVTNNAAAVLLFPFCLETARLYDADPRPFLIALILSASASFMTPIGYQTNMMVYGPGGYRYGDFFRIGAPLNLLLAAVAITLIPRIWPLG